VDPQQKKINELESEVRRLKRDLDYYRDQTAKLQRNGGRHIFIHLWDVYPPVDGEDNRRCGACSLAPGDPRHLRPGEE
jgi:hypothetical protein